MGKDSKKYIQRQKVSTFNDCNRELDNLRKRWEDNPLVFGHGSPEGKVRGKLGYIYSDRKNGLLYVKQSSDKALTGWVVK